MTDLTKLPRHKEFLITELMRLAADRKTKQEAADYMRITYEAVNRYSKLYDIEFRSPQKAHQHYDAICDMYAKGLTYQVIAHKFGVSRQRVYQIIQEGNLKNAKGDE